MLSDQIDRLSRNTRAIRGIAAQTASSHLTLFTNAVLSVPLGDLIRDIDPAELGLFSLQSSQPTRAEFTGATPLRKQRDDVHKTNEIEPETYAEAALKCIDRYHTIRPMPRGQSQINTILERLALVRDNIQNLSDTLRQAQSTQERSLKSLIDEEEERIRNLQVRLKQLNERNNAQKPLADRRLAGVRPTPKTKPPPPPLSPQEDDFWNTPAVGARTLRFTDNLMDEQVDLGDITTSFISPIHYSKPGALSPPVRDDSFVQDPLVPLSFERNDDDDEKGHLEEEKDISELDGEKKIVLQNHFPEPDITEPGCSPAPKPQEVAHETNMPAVLNTPDASTVKVKVNSEVERITARIWTTIGDLIMPGHPFDTSSHGLGAKPPRAKETLTHLQSLCTMSPSPASPQASSISSPSSTFHTTPTSQQILTAYLILSLLASPSHFSLPLNKVKDLLSTKANANGGLGAGSTRILYGCVAKRLMKIERGGGEQIVKFDI